jgi:uncharacterized protein YkwD
MSAPSTSGRGVARTLKGTAKVIRLPPPRRTGRKRIARIGTVVVALGLAGVIALRINGLHTTRLETAEIESPMSVQEFQILKLVNDERSRAGLDPLQFSPRLMVAARNHSRDMAMHHYLGHGGPNGDTPADRVRAVGVKYDELAENVYSDNFEPVSSLAERTIKRWLQSSAHRANLLSPHFRLSAAGVTRATNGEFYVTEDFIR